MSGSERIVTFSPRCCQKTLHTYPERHIDNVALLGRMAFSSKISSLWQPMLGVGMGIRSSSAAFVASPPPLQRQLAAIGIAAADMPCGRRPAVAGFVVAVASLVKAATTDGHASGILQHHLQASIIVLPHGAAAAAKMPNACLLAKTVRWITLSHGWFHSRGYLYPWSDNKCSYPQGLSHASCNAGHQAT